MKKRTKVIIEILVASVIIFFIFLTFNNSDEEKIEEESVVETEAGIFLEIIENTVYLKDGDDVTHDILTISDEFGVILELNNIGIEDEVLASKKFITKYDINFDGIKDVAVLDGIGYGGGNLLYNYFIVNEETKKFEDYEEIPYVSNFTFDADNKLITSTYRSGQDFLTEEYIFVEDGYMKI
jgi:hypothetical protein